MKKFIIATTTMLIIGLGTISFATGYSSPSEILTKLTKKSQEHILEESNYKSYGKIAQENDVFEDFQKEMLKQKKIMLDEKVKSNIITKEEADLMYKRMNENMKNCDPSNSLNNKSINRMNKNGFCNK